MVEPLRYNSVILETRAGPGLGIDLNIKHHFESSERLTLGGQLAVDGFSKSRPFLDRLNYDPSDSDHLGFKTYSSHLESALGQLGFQFLKDYVYVSVGGGVASFSQSTYVVYSDQGADGNVSEDYFTHVRPAASLGFGARCLLSSTGLVGRPSPEDGVLASLNMGVEVIHLFGESDAFAEINAFPFLSVLKIGIGFN